MWWKVPRGLKLKVLHSAFICMNLKCIIHAAFNGERWNILFSANPWNTALDYTPQSHIKVTLFIMVIYVKNVAESNWNIHFQTNVGVRCQKLFFFFENSRNFRDLNRFSGFWFLSEIWDFFTYMYIEKIVWIKFCTQKQSNFGGLS